LQQLILHSAGPDVTKIKGVAVDYQP